MSALQAAIDALATVDVHGIAEPVLLVGTEDVLVAMDRLSGVLARQLQAMSAREVTDHECGRSTRAWLIEEQHLAPEEASRRLAVARAIVYHPGIGAALLAGQINHDHARVIATCLRRLPADWRDAAETELIAAAGQVDPLSLTQLCQELRVRSGADEDVEAAAQRRYDSRWATVTRTFDGMHHLEAMLDPEAGAILTAALAPLMHPAGDVDDRTAAQRRADAITDLAGRALNAGQLPDHGGERPHLTVTIPYAELLETIRAGLLGHATTNGNLPISPATARRIACDANLIPAVLGGASEVLDLGRSSPTWTRAQRRAAALRDGGCVFPNCQTGLDRCQLHHLHYKARGGPTNHHNSANVCRYHHHLVHHSNWTITRTTAGKIEVHRT